MSYLSIFHFVFIIETKPIEKLVNDLEDNNIKISKHGNNYDRIKHHVERIAASVPVRNFIQDVTNGVIYLDVNGWVSFAKQCYTQFCGYFSDR